MNIKQTIIHNQRILKQYDLDFIDSKIIELIKIHCIKENIHKSFASSISAKLNCFLGLTNQSLNYIELSSKKFNKIIQEFVVFIRNKGFSSEYRSYQNDLTKLARLISSIKENIPSVQNIQTNANETYDIKKIDNNMLSYFNDWGYEHKAKKCHVNPSFIYKILEDQKVKIIKARLDNCFAVDFQKNTLALVVYNEFVSYIKKENNITEIINDPSIFKVFLLNFCKYYFNNKQNNNRDLPSSIILWNRFVDFFNYVFIESKVFTQPDGGLPKAPNRNKPLFQNNIKESGGTQYKKKLITDIPLEITDDAALELLFKKINQDVDIINIWANEKIDNLYQRAIKEKHFNYEILGSKENFYSYFNYKENIVSKLHEYGIPTKTDLEPFMYMLVNEHPEITESFLLSLKLYDRNNNVFCIRKTDNQTYLIGEKLRKGTKDAEQKILLNEKSKILVDKLLLITKFSRDYLQHVKNNDYKCLFIAGVNKSIKPEKVTKITTIPESRVDFAGSKAIIEYFEKKFNLSNQDAKNFVMKMSVTKFRASKAVQVYIKTGDTKKMSEALGHKKYKPDLLNAYLPEPIQNFFQTRWIRLFQKGIICEAMKDSKYLLKASNFKNIEDLDMFLKNHALKNIPDESVNKDTKTKNGELYIAIDENILIALLSLEKAVTDSTSLVNPKASYWASFSRKLVHEIENNNSYTLFKKVLNDARTNIDVNLFKEFIYE
jgi:hypothetical protein